MRLKAVDLTSDTQTATQVLQKKQQSTPRVLFCYTNWMKTFTEKVKKIVSKIPEGSVMTYKKVATAAGNPKASRAVANIMAANYDEKVPCHRVIRSDGGLGGYNRGGVEVKKKMLIKEGVVL